MTTTEQIVKMLDELVSTLESDGASIYLGDVWKRIKARHAETGPEATARHFTEAETEKRVDAIVAGVNAAKDAELTTLRERLAEFETWAKATCGADCEPYRKIGRHAPNCPVGDLRIGDDR